MGLWIVLYLFEHLLVNSQAAMWFGDDGSNFVRMVNSLESLPFVRAIEILLIGVPIGLHMVWGIHRVLTAKTNAMGLANAPALPYGRNRAFTWQRLTSWILLFGILGHVLQMRFVDQPKKVEGSYVVQVSQDDELPLLAQRFHVKLEGERAICPDPGSAFLLLVRDTFKQPLMLILYSIFVLAAAFHAFNGVWTFLITWGILLSARSQKAFLPIAWCGVCLLAFFGLSAIWGSYWL